MSGRTFCPSLGRGSDPATTTAQFSDFLSGGMSDSLIRRKIVIE
jgi:hypothetical protein